jgi:hypothetical protein
MDNSKLEKHLVVGNKYVFVVLEDLERFISPDIKETERTYIGEFRGWDYYREYPQVVAWLENPVISYKPLNIFYQSDIIEFHRLEKIKEKELKYEPMWYECLFYSPNDSNNVSSTAKLRYVVMEKNYVPKRSQLKEDFAYAVFRYERDAKAFISTILES